MKLLKFWNTDYLINHLEKIESMTKVIKEQQLVAEQQINNMKCCGNCVNAHVANADSYCEISGEQINCHRVCDKWCPDGLTNVNRK
jgi:urocanate hydratase